MGSPSQHSGSAPSSQSPEWLGSLESSSFSDRPDWEVRLKAYPTSGEVTLYHLPWWFHLARSRPRDTVAFTPPAPPTDNGKRAKGCVRRFARHNRLRFLWTLTYANAAADWAQVQRDIHLFLRRMRMWRGHIPLIAVIEVGRGGSRGSLEQGNLHVHFAVDRFLSIEQVRRRWPHGYVYVGDPQGVSGRLPVRRLAGYLAKYVTKDVAQADGGGAGARPGCRHRYFVTRGFQPPRYRFAFQTEAEALRFLRREIGADERSYRFGDGEVGGINGIWFLYADREVAGWKRRHPPPRPDCGPAAPKSAPQFLT